MAITDIERLRIHLQWAIELEHSTLPPYLTALYSLHAEHNRQAAGVLLSVAIEEMLHMMLVANVLNAVGGQPRLDHPEFLPQYPAYMPHSNRAFQIHLARFCPESVETFMRIEKPEDHFAVPEDENYETIGQFYDALEVGLVRLCAELGEAAVFSGDPARQLAPEAFHYAGSGKVIVVTDLATARQALEEIKEQGEGLNHKAIWDGDRSMFHPSRRELSHYFRFNEIYTGRCYAAHDTPQSGPTGAAFPVDWSAVYNSRSDPGNSDYPEGSEIRAKLEAFNQAYCDMLRLMHRSFNGQPEMMAVAVGVMYEIKHRAVELMQMPSGDGKTTVGLTFEYAPPLTAAQLASTPRRIVVRRNGPYIVEGDVPLCRKSRVMSELGEALTWKNETRYERPSTCALCRCGRSDAKPYCDGSHVRARFDGTETASAEPRSSRVAEYPGTKIMVKHDRTICAFSTFCENKVTDVWEMAEQTGDTRVRAQVIAMIERCPSGALTYELESLGEANEPSLPLEISVIADGPLWVTGGIAIERADGQAAEVRNRITLCRCGRSKNKPYCDGTHIDVKFQG